MIDPATITGITAAIIGGITSVGLLMRRLSKDKLEIERNRAEGDLISDLIKQRDDARRERDKVESELMKIGIDADGCLEKVKELMSREQQLRIQNAMLSSLIERLAETLDSSKQELADALRQAGQVQETKRRLQDQAP